MAYSCVVEIAAPLENVWDAWRTPEILGVWLAPRLNVDFREGGAWEFFWNEDPAKDSTLGCKLVSIEPHRVLRFEWQGKTEFLPMFQPPTGSRTVIEVRFEKTERGARVTVMEPETRKLPAWAAYETWMAMAWEMALGALKEACESSVVARPR